VGLFRTAARQAIDALGHLTGDRGETLRMLYFLGYLPRLHRPRSFNEKVVARKLHGGDVSWIALADKVAVRDVVASCVGPEHLTTLLLVTDDPLAVRYDTLPERFVVKASHGSGWVRVIGPTPSRPSEPDLQALCRQWLDKRYGLLTHEDWYARIPPRVVVEEFLHDRTFAVPLDFKCWVFHGRVEFVQVDFDRFTGHTRAMYDRQWRRLPWVTLFPAGPDLPRPRQLEALIAVAEALAVDPAFVRVDLYCPNDERVVFGELTFTPDAGWGRFSPSSSYDQAVGRLW
jgi:hypothetical protein